MDSTKDPSTGLGQAPAIAQHSGRSLLLEVKGLRKYFPIRTGFLRTL